MNDVQLINGIALSKYKTLSATPGKYFWRAFMAGIFLGVATLFAFTMGAGFQDNPTVARLALASTFGIGLVAISFLGAELFTGNCFTAIIPVFDRKVKFSKTLGLWGMCYLGNACGLILVVSVFVLSGAQRARLMSYIQPIIEARLDFNVWQLLLKAILCNFVVCIAAYGNMKMKNEAAKLFFILLFVTAFVFPGLEHCIANIGLFTLGVVGLGGAVDWTMMPLHMLIATIGNIIGGSILLGLPVFLGFRNKGNEEAAVAKEKKDEE